MLLDAVSQLFQVLVELRLAHIVIGDHDVFQRDGINHFIRHAVLLPSGCWSLLTVLDAPHVVQQFRLHRWGGEQHLPHSADSTTASTSSWLPNKILNRCFLSWRATCRGGSSLCGPIAALQRLAPCPLLLSLRPQTGCTRRLLPGSWQGCL